MEQVQLLCQSLAKMNQNASSGVCLSGRTYGILEIVIHHTVFGYRCYDDGGSAENISVTLKSFRLLSTKLIKSQFYDNTDISVLTLYFAHYRC